MAGGGRPRYSQSHESRSYGETPRRSCWRRSKFEPWQTRHRELLSLFAAIAEYTRAANIFDGIAGARIEDPTGGATHFLNEKIVRQRRAVHCRIGPQGKARRSVRTPSMGGTKTQVAAAEHQDPFIEFANGKEWLMRSNRHRPPPMCADQFKKRVEEFANPEQ